MEIRIIRGIVKISFVKVQHERKRSDLFSILQQSFVAVLLLFDITIFSIYGLTRIMKWIIILYRNGNIWVIMKKDSIDTGIGIA